jgi:pimeloyl-ACP methyl ester carboxylesterase
MKRFVSDGVEIAYLDQGDGEPVLLIHGFASNAKVNWLNTSWMQTLTRNGFRAIAMDNRGHGESGKLYDEAAYRPELMAEDAFRLLRHLGIPRAHVMGYSMGARIAVFLALAHPDVVQSLVISGMGGNLIAGVGAPGPIAAALVAPSPEDVKNDAARSFRLFADQTGSDRKALAACIRASRVRLAPEELARLDLPVLIAVGTEDVIAGPADALQPFIANAQVLNIVGRDHMKAVGDQSHKDGVIAFLESQRRSSTRLNAH